MKKTLSRLLSLALVLAMVCAMIPAAMAANVTSVAVTPTTASLKVGDASTGKATLTATVTADEGADTTVTWAAYSGDSGTTASDIVTLTPNDSANTVEVTAVKAGTARIVATSDGDTTKSATATITVAAADLSVSIAAEGNKLAYAVGETIKLTATASGAYGDGTYSYQWYLGDAAIGGATTATLTLIDVKTANAGNYKCHVVSTDKTDSAKKVEKDSSALAITVTEELVASVAAKGNKLAYAVGDTVELTATASGAYGDGTYSYQWYLGDSVIGGATSATLQLTNVKTTDAGSYKCYVTSTDKTDSTKKISEFSNAVAITVNAKQYRIQFTSKPASIKAGSAGTLMVQVQESADGTTYTAYQTAVSVSFSVVSGSTYGHVANDSVTSNSTTGYASNTLYGDAKGTVTVRATIANPAGGSALTADATVSILGTSAAEDIYYDSDSDGYAVFEGYDFYKAVWDASGSTLKYVLFSSPVGGTLYKTDDDTSVSNKVSSSTRCYYNSSTGVDLDEVTFIVDSDRNSHYVDYTAYSSTGNELASGRVYIDDDGSVTGDITYYVDSEEVVTLDEDDFQDFFEDEYSNGDLDFVKFKTGEATNYGTTTYGYLYETDETRASKVSSSAKYYYDASSSQDALDEVEFRAGTKSSDYIVKIPFTATGDDKNGRTRTVDGTLVIKVNDDGSSDEEMTYYVDSEDTVALSEDDFEDYFLDEYKDGELDYVKFDIGEAKNYGTSAYGYLYESDATKAGKVYASTKYYFEASSSQDDLDEVEFRAGTRTSVYTVKVPFTATGEDKNGRTRSVDGTLTIVVNDRKGVTITTDGATFDDLKLVKTLTPKNVSSSKLDSYYVQFTKVTGGTLYAYYKTAANNEEWSKRDEFYFNADSDEYDLGDVFFLPKSNVKSAEISYTIYRESGKNAIEVDTGKIVFKVEQAKVTVTFTDIPANVKTWAGDAIEYMAKQGYVSGTGSKTFSPNANMSRAMLVTVLYRMAGEPSVSSVSNPFSDVVKGSYYYNAVLWAYNKGIVTGKSANKFAPNDNVSRQEIAAIIYRYAGKPAATGTLTGFSDYAKVSSYATDAMKWATRNEIITGIGGKLVPGSAATRAQVVAMLYRYLNA